MTPPSLQRIAAALYAPDAPPAGAPWNAGELAGILAPEQPRTPAAVLVPLIERAAGVQVLLTRRTDSLRHHAGQISFPGGRMEPDDESPLAAALRETCEEVGLAPDRLEPLGFLDPFETITGYHVWPAVARVATPFQLRPDPSEVAEAFEVPLGFLLDPGNCRQVGMEYAGRVRHYYQFQYGQHRIWGATASMLVNLRERLLRQL